MGVDSKGEKWGCKIGFTLWLLKTLVFDSPEKLYKSGGNTRTTRWWVKEESINTNLTHSLYLFPHYSKFAIRHQSICLPLVFPRSVSNFSSSKSNLYSLLESLLLVSALTDTLTRLLELVSGWTPSWLRSPPMFHLRIYLPYERDTPTTHPPRTPMSPTIKYCMTSRSHGWNQNGCKDGFTLDPYFLS